MPSNTAPIIFRQPERTPHAATGLAIYRKPCLSNHRRCRTQHLQAAPTRNRVRRHFPQLLLRQHTSLFPSLSVGTEELLARVVEKYQSEYGSTASRTELEQSLRWSGADLAEYLFDGGAAGNAAAQSVQAAVRQEADWDDLYDRFRQCFPRACRRATEDLLRAKLVAPDFVAVACDEDEELIAPSLTLEQLQRHFPEFM